VIVRQSSTGRSTLAVLTAVFLTLVLALGSDGAAADEPPTAPSDGASAPDASSPVELPAAGEAAADSPPADQSDVANEASAAATEETPAVAEPTVSVDAGMSESDATTESAQAAESVPAAEETETAANDGEPGDSEIAESPSLPPKPAEVNVLDAVPAPGSTSVAAESENPPDPAGAVQESDPPAELDLPPEVAAAMDNFVGEASEPQMLKFVFRYQPWEDVLQWFADQAGLSLLMEAAPPGTLNYTDDRLYTPAQAIDLLNSVLLIKGYTLVRHDRMLMVINLDDGVPPNLVTTIPEEELDERGEYELVRVLFQLDKFEPADAEKEIAQLIGPQGAIVVLPKTKQLLVTETAGRLRTIRRVIGRIEDPQGLMSGKLEGYQFQSILPDEAILVMRQLLDIPADANATSDGTFRFAMDPMGMRLLFSGSAEKVAKAKEILTMVDVASGAGGQGLPASESLQLEVYPITVADPESVLKVMQTLLEGLPGVRLSIDPKTNSLVALARLSDHATIRATITQMQAEVRRIEVIYLQRVDPQLAAISIKKVFGEAGEKNPSAPTVEADSAGRQLLVHGTEAQIEQIRVLLGKMGETEFTDGPMSTGSRIRVVPITGSAAETALERLRMIWPAISDNPLREVTPSAMIPSLDRSESIPARVPGKGAEQRPQREPLPSRFLPQGGVPELSRPPLGAQPPAERQEPVEDRQTARPIRGHFHLASQTEEPDPPAAAEESPSDQPQPAPDSAAEQPADKPEIVISRGPNGLMIISDDVEALDEIERLLNSFSGGADPDRTELTVFYLKYAKASVVAETLTKIIGSGTTGSSTAAADSILGQLVTSSLGSTMGSLMNLGATTLSPTGMLRITPEPRLNALIVEANATDLRNIEEVLKLLDQPASPEEVLVNPRSRLIPVYNTLAEEMATIVKAIFAEKMQGASSRGSGGGDDRRPSPEDIIAAMRGGRSGSSERGGSSGGSAATRVEPERMTIGVDARSNSLIVYASESLYEEVRMLVEELDTVAGAVEGEATEVITLKGVSPEAMNAALRAIMGDSAAPSSSSSNRPSTSRSSSSTAGSSSSRSSSSQPSSGMSDEMRRRIEFFRSMQGGGGFGGPGGGTPGGASSRGGSTGGGGRPGGR
jgi:type II secretory pathway component GspD/PulD (secretin)